MATMKVTSPICAVLYYFYFICALYTNLFGNVCAAEEFPALNNVQTNNDTELFPSDNNGIIDKGMKRKSSVSGIALELLTTPDYLRVLPKRQFRMKHVHHLKTFVGNETIQIKYTSSSERPLTKAAPIKSTPNEQKMTTKPKPLTSTTTVKPKVFKHRMHINTTHKAKHRAKAIITTSGTKPKQHKARKMHRVQPPTKAHKINKRATHAAKHLYGTKHTIHNHKIHSNQPRMHITPESKHNSKGKLKHKKVPRSNIHAKMINNFTKRYTNSFDKKVYAPTLSDSTPSLLYKQKMQEKEYDHETIFARILRYLNKKLAPKDYGYTASIRIRRTTIANGCIIDPETVVTVLENFNSLSLHELSIRAGRSGDSQILDVFAIQPRGPTNTSKPVVTTLKVRSIFEFGNTLYAANISKNLARDEDLLIIEWKRTKKPEELTDIPIRLVGYPASNLPVTSCYGEFGQDFNRTTMYCIQRVRKFNKYLCEDHLGSLLVNSKTKDVLAVLTRRMPCGDIAAFTKMEEVLKDPSPEVSIINIVQEISRFRNKVLEIGKDEFNCKRQNWVIWKTLKLFKNLNFGNCDSSRFKYGDLKVS